MTALVRIALRRPYTFVVLALLLLIIGPLAASRTPVDIFPDSNISSSRSSPIRRSIAQMAISVCRLIGVASLSQAATVR